MHEVHCHRNIALCKHCQEPIPKGELEIHYEETHAEIPCPKCGQKVEKCLLEKHEEELCPKRPVKCTFCEMDVAHSELEAHHDYCGTRTEACPKCGQFIMVKDLVKHEDSNCTYPTPKLTNQNPASSNLTNGNSTGASSFAEPDDLLFGGGEMNMFAFEEMKRILNATEGPGASGLTVSDGMGQRKKPSGSVMRARGHATDASKNTGRLSKDKNKANQKSDLNRLRDLTMLPCEFCGEVIPSNQLVMHQSHCTEDPFSSLMPHAASTASSNIPPHIDDNRYSRLSQNSRPSAAPHMIDNLRNVAPAEWSPEEWEASGDDIMLPCEFCDDLYPQDMLVQHQAVCDRNTMMTPRVMSPAVTRSSATRRPPRPNVPSAKSRRQQPSIDIGAILSSNASSKVGASNAMKGTHSYELDSTLRKYGSGSFDPYTERHNRRMVREGTFSMDDEPENRSPRQVCS
ncbi:hypothetical protein FSP39_004224 [Pinctada imbricata]|uniref:TRAF-type domain-containing protein n=1 Tax=Pinctada imbricata TaxID=66713 RepID=A0AA89BIQ6_PINIB|nr:hypothetical protein FSP39_004224 [Pinctada imbricata]